MKKETNSNELKKEKLRQLMKDGISPKKAYVLAQQMQKKAKVKHRGKK